MNFPLLQLLAGVTLCTMAVLAFGQASHKSTAPEGVIPRILRCMALVLMFTVGVGFILFGLFVKEISH